MQYSRTKTDSLAGLPDGEQDESSSKQQKNDHLMQTALLQELFTKELQDMLWAEVQLLNLWNALQQVVSDSLGIMLAKSITESVVQIQRLRSIVEKLLNLRANPQKCQGMAGLIAEANLLITHTQQITKIRDVAIIMAMQKINRYKVTSYEAMTALAEMRGQVMIKQLLSDSLMEEKENEKNLAIVFGGLTDKLR